MARPVTIFPGSGLIYLSISSAQKYRHSDTMGWRSRAGAVFYFNSPVLRSCVARCRTLCLTAGIHDENEVHAALYGRKKRIGTAQGLVGPASGRGSRRCRRRAADDMPSARCFDEDRHSWGRACPGPAGAADFADFAGISGAAIVAALFPQHGGRGPRPLRSKGRSDSGSAGRRRVFGAGFFRKASSRATELLRAPDTAEATSARLLLAATLYGLEAIAGESYLERRMQIVPDGVVGVRAGEIAFWVAKQGRKIHVQRDAQPGDTSPGDVLPEDAPPAVAANSPRPDALLSFAGYRSAIDVLSGKRQAVVALGSGEVHIEGLLPLVQGLFAVLDRL